MCQNLPQRGGQPATPIPRAPSAARLHSSDQERAALQVVELDVQQLG